MVSEQVVSEKVVSEVSNQVASEVSVVSDQNSEVSEPDSARNLFQFSDSRNLQFYVFCSDSVVRSATGSETTTAGPVVDSETAAAGPVVDSETTSGPVIDSG